MEKIETSDDIYFSSLYLCRKYLKYAKRFFLFTKFCCKSWREAPCWARSIFYFVVFGLEDFFKLVLFGVCQFVNKNAAH